MEHLRNIMEIMERNGLTLGDYVAKTAQKISFKEVRNAVDIEVLVYDRRGNQIGHAPFTGIEA